MLTSLRKISTQVGLAVPPYTGMREALQWMMLARLGTLFVLLAAFFAGDVLLKGQGGGGSQFSLALGLMVVCFGVTLFQSTILEYMEIGWGVVSVHIAFDAAVTSVWIALGRSSDSLFALLYLIQILIVSLTFYRRGALLASGVAIFFFGLVCMSRHSEATNGLTVWAIYSCIFLVLGFVGGFLSEELRRTTQSLALKNTEIEKLTALHERIISDIPTGLLTIDHDTKINFINPAAEHILGILSRSAVGKRLDEVKGELLPFFTSIESENIADVEEGLIDPRETSLSATGTEFHRSLFLKAKSERGGQARLQQTVEIGKGLSRRTLRGDVAELDVEAGVGRLLDEKAKSGRVLLFQDVTKLIHLEEKLKQHEKLAAVGQLAAGIAHEIRNPLASMSASIEMLKGAQEWTDPENKKLMEITLKEIDRLNGLISEFLDFVKPDKFKVGNVDLKSLLSDIVTAARGMQEFKEKAELKEKFGESTAMANGEKLKQVIWNLLLNAVQAMKKKGVIEVGCETVNSQRVRFWVEDTGAGMTEEVLNHLYEPFFTTKEKGTGLGLPTAYKIIEAHHGEIKVTSQPEKGTRFEILLPSA